jgi:hypothetical protein
MFFTGDDMAMRNIFVRLGFLVAVIAYMLNYMISCKLQII